MHDNEQQILGCYNVFDQGLESLSFLFNLVIFDQKHKVRLAPNGRTLL